jgi:tetratricopeptide (TPR) repeat protein
MTIRSLRLVSAAVAVFVTTGVVSLALAQTSSAPAGATSEPATAPATVTKPATTASATPTSAEAPTSAPASPFARVATPTTSPSIEDMLIARALSRSAKSIMFTPKAPTIAPRLVALTQMSFRLDPTDPDNLQLLSDIQQSMGKDKQAAQNLQYLLSIYPSSWTLANRWLQHTMKSMEFETSSSRLLLLRELMNDPQAPAAFRAEAAFRQALIYSGQGQKNEAMDAVYKTLEFDPQHAPALMEKYRNLTNPTPVDRVTLLLNLLKANPRQVKVAWDLASMTNIMGLYEQSAAMYNFTSVLLQLSRNEDPRKIETFHVQYYSSLLDLLQSKRDSEGAKKLAPMIEQACKVYPQNADLQQLLIECYQAAGQKEDAQKTVASLKATFEDRLKRSTMTSDLAAEVAWFYLMTLNDAKLGMQYAREAAKINDKSPLVNRILGVAELLSDDDALHETGEKRLRTLMERDPFAGVAMAEYYDRKGNTQEFNVAVAACATTGRSGPAFRRLRDLIYKVEQRDKKTIALPDVPQAKEVVALLETFDTRNMNVLNDSNKFISVTIKPLKDKVLPGEPIEVEAVLTNTSAMALSLGENGLFSPVMQLIVKVGQDPKAPVFYNLPMVVWQAPKYLGTTQSIRTRVRLDVGPLASYLAARPFEEIQIQIGGVLDGDVRGQNFVSSMPTLKIEPSVVTRGNILTLSSKFNATDESTIVPAYKDILTTITQKSILRGELTDRILAADQVCSLLAAARNAELSNVKLPAPLVTEINKPLIQAMLQALLKDKSPAVRVEALVSLPDASPDQTTINLVALLQDDPHPAVRLRVLDTLGTVEVRGQERLLTKFGIDRDDLIQALAKAMLR